jgi:hypothetical protein
MSESESYWLGLVEKLAASTESLRGGDGALDGEPAWVTKITCEVFNIVTPKMQLRAGIKPTPYKIGVMLASNLIHTAQAAAFVEVPKPTTGTGLNALEMGIKLATPPGFDLAAASQNLPAFKAKICSVVVQVLKERPIEEASEFFRGLSRGLKQNPKGLVPKVVNGVPQFTAKQFERLGTLMIYSLARNRWRELEELGSSQIAFEWFEKRIPAQLLGNDPERIRKMFYRVGKRFKNPGRPRKRDRVVARLLR